MECSQGRVTKMEMKLKTEPDGGKEELGCVKCRNKKNGEGRFKRTLKESVND